MAFPCRFAWALQQLPSLSVIDGLSLSNRIVSAPGLLAARPVQPPARAATTSVTSITHVAAGAKPVLSSSAGNEGVENQLGPLARILAVDAERVGASRVGVRGS